MLHGHPFNQRKRTTEMSGRGDCKEGSAAEVGWTKFGKEGVGNVGRVFIN